MEWVTVAYSAFKHSDAFKRSFSESIAQDLHSKASLSKSSGVYLWQAQPCLPPDTENLEGSAMSRATWGAMPPSMDRRVNPVVMDVFKQSIMFPTFELIVQFAANVIGWNSHFWKWEWAGFAEAWVMCPQWLLPVCPQILSLLNSMKTNTS